MDRFVVASAWTAVLAVTLGAGCSGSEKPQTTGGGGGGGGASSSSGVGSSGSVASSAASTSGPSAVASTGAGGTGGGGAAFVCDPPAAPGSIYETSGESLNPEDVEPISMCKYRGEVMLVVNTAAA